MTYVKGETPCNWCISGNHYKCKKLRYCSCNCPNIFTKIMHNNQNTHKTHCIHGHELTIENVYMSKNSNHRICKECIRIKRLVNHDAIRLTARKHYHLHKAEISLMRRINRKNVYEKAKVLVITHYGRGKTECLCCGENELSMLTIDHIIPIGRKNITERGRRGHLLYRYLIKQKYPEGYQTLCFNCNFAKQTNNNICPHKTKKPLITVTEEWNSSGR